MLLADFVKGKAVPVHAMKAQGCTELQFAPFITSVIDSSEFLLCW